MKKILFFTLCFLLPYPCFGAGEITTTYWSQTRTVKELQIHWVSLPGGTVAGAQTPTAVVSGVIERIAIQSYGGSLMPDTNYNLQLKDEDNYDLLAGAFANVKNPTETASYVPLVAPITLTSKASNITRVGQKIAIDDKLSLIISDAGDQNGGIVHVYYR